MAYTNQRIFFRQRGSEYGAAAWWGHADVNHTPKDIPEPGTAGANDLVGAASVFILPLKPGDYEFYDFQFFWNGYGGSYRAIHAREKFVVPMRLEAGKAYYIGEFRSRCIDTSACYFVHRDRQQRDEVIARRYSPHLPTLESMQLDLLPASPFVIPEKSDQLDGLATSKENKQ